MAPEATAEPAKASILVVDDDPRIRQAIQWALEEEGFVVETAADGQQALERATAARPALVVLDLRLPGVDGAAVVAGLRAAYGQLPPIVLVTAEDRVEEQARHLGAYAYLTKPFELDDLIATIRRGLGARQG